MTESFNTHVNAQPGSRPGLFHAAWRILRYPARVRPLLFFGIASVCLTIGIQTAVTASPASRRVIPSLVMALSGMLGLSALLVLPPFLVSIVNRTAAGEWQCPGRLRLSDPAGLAVSALKFYAAVAWSLLPLLIYLASLDAGRLKPAMPPAAALGALACLYLPMSLLRVSVTGKLWQSLLPSNVIEPIVRTFPRYWLVWLAALGLALYLPLSFPLSRLPVVGPALTMFCGLYLCAAWMHGLGRFLRSERERLGWA